MQDKWDRISLGLFLAAFLSKRTLPAQYYFLLHLLLTMFCSLYPILIILKSYSSPGKMKEKSWSGHPWEACCTLGQSHFRQCWVWGSFLFTCGWLSRARGRYFRCSEMFHCSTTLRGFCSSPLLSVTSVLVCSLLSARKSFMYCDKGIGDAQTTS